MRSSYAVIRVVLESKITPKKLVQRMPVVSPTCNDTDTGRVGYHGCKTKQGRAAMQVRGQRGALVGSCVCAAIRDREIPAVPAHHMVRAVHTQPVSMGSHRR
jgi:hypothetical protein